MKLPILATTLAAATLILACQTEKKQPPAGNFTNPNGASELAILMNEMYAEALVNKQKIESGESPNLSVAAEKMLTCAATEPEKVASPEYRAFAASYLESVRLLKNASLAAQPEHFKMLVTACMNCHESLCPGPTKRIRKLVLAN